MSTGTSAHRASGEQPRVRADHSSGPSRLADVIVPALLLVALVLLTVAVVRGLTVRIDDPVYEATPGGGNGPAVPDVLALVVVDIGTPAVCVAVVLLLAVALWVRTRRIGPLIMTASATALLTLTVLLGKGLIPRPLPGFAEVVGDRGAYPSGHTATALVCAGLLAELVSQARPALRRRAWLAVAAWTVLVAAGLLWLHFHWLSDVVGSMLLGSLILWLLLRWPLRLGMGGGRRLRDGGRVRSR